MRRLIAVAAVCGSGLLAGCSGGAATARPTAKPSPATSTASPSPDPKAKVICDDLHQNVLDVDAKAFGAALGRMIADHAAGNKDKQAQDQAAAVAKLNEVSARLRTDAGEATDDRLKTALANAASGLDALAADTDGLSKLDSLDAVSETDRKFAAATGAVADYCAGL